MKKLSYFFVLTLMILSSNAFSQWTFVGGVTGIAGTGESPSISAVSPTCAWVASGAAGTIPLVSRTTNGGTTWVNTPIVGLAALDLFCLWAVDSLTCYVGNGGASGGAGGNATFYRTTDGGLTWTAVASTGGTAGFFNSIQFSRKTPNFGITQSDPPTGTGQAYYMNITTNGGTNWSVINPPGVSGAASAQNGAFVVDNLFFGFGLNAAPSRIRYTTDGGTTWVTGTLGIVGGFVSGVAFHDNKTLGVATTGDAAGSSLPNIARTSNGGSTWAIINTGTGLTGYGSLKWVSNSNTIYLSGTTGTGGVIRKSTNAGLNWVTQTTSGLTGVAHIDYYRSGSTVWGYAVCTDGSVLKVIETVTGVENPSSNIPSEYSLEQNYPNPFNPVTTISFSVPMSSNVSLKIYDALGNEVVNAINEYKTPGSYSYILNAASLSSGVYFYTLQAGDFVSTKKLTLVK